MAGRRKADPDTLAAMRARAPQASPDFAGADEAPHRDGHAPLLPLGCPVVPLGLQGSKIWFMDGSNQIQGVTTECRKNDMKLWFGDSWLVSHYEELSKDGNPTGKFNQDRSSTALIEDCRARGIFNPQGRVFGRGAHRFPGDAVQLALHMGDRVMLANAPNKEGKRHREPIVRPAGRIADRDGREAFFPALMRLPPPAPEMSSEGDGEALLAKLQRWYWVDSEASPLLLLGMIGQMFICGALDWRAHVWLAAPTASGKTWLQKLIQAALGDWCLHTEDASEAAIRQVLGDDTLPVLIDEAEAHDRPERLQAILNLMKKSSSGAKMYRGGVDHKATEFTAQSCFLLSSVLHASMRGEDRNRIVILDLRAIPADAEPLQLELAHWQAMGRKMHRRMVQLWPRFEQTLVDYQAGIAKAGYEGRWRDTYGTLLACADLLLFDRATRDIIPDANVEAGSDRVARLVALISPTIARGRVESRSDVDRVLVHMMSHMLPGAHGQPGEPVGLWVDRAMGLRRVATQFETDADHYEVNEDARAKLKAYGMRVVNIEADPRAGAMDKMKLIDARPDDWTAGFLAVAYSTNKMLAEVFRGSEWAGDGYVQSLVKVPGARKWKAKVRFAGINPDYAVLVPLAAFKGSEE